MAETRPVLNNMMESVVLQKLEENSDALGCCSCPICKLDIASYVLNRLPPRYIVTHEGELYTKLESLSIQHDADLITLLSQAAAVIGKSPRHSVKTSEA